MRPQKRLLMSMSEPNITKILMLVLEKEFANRYHLSIAEAPYVAELLAQAQREPADVFLLLLNNLMCSDVSLLGEKNKGERGLSAITHLRDSYQKPVIALMGWYPEDGSWSEENLKQAGACVSFVIPPDGAPFINAVSECLEKGALIERRRLP